MQEILIGNIRGPKGDTGNGLTIKEFYSTIDELPDNPSVGDAYGVGEEGAYEIYIYSATKGWVNSGAFQPDINEQAPNYDEATTLESLSSGEKISLAFGKIKKAIKEFITHKGDTVGHITKDERTAWNGKAPGGCGLGGTGAGTQALNYANVLSKGCGFYQVGSIENSPHGTSEWTGLIQLIRDLQSGKETGSQLSIHDLGAEPKMWLRTIRSGIPKPWVEMLHTGNISNYCGRIKTGTYVGVGAYSLVGEHFKTISVDFVPKLMIISRRVNNEYFETNVIPFSEDVVSGVYCNIKVMDDYTYARSLFSYNSTDKVLKIYNKSGVVYRDKIDLATGYMSGRVEYDFKNTSYEKSYGCHSLLDGEGETYEYVIIG